MLFLLLPVRRLAFPGVHLRLDAPVALLLQEGLQLLAKVGLEGGIREVGGDVIQFPRVGAEVIKLLLRPALIAYRTVAGASALVSAATGAVAG
jgi:hypothetical protein